MLLKFKKFLLIILSIIFFIFEDFIWNKIVIVTVEWIKKYNLYNT